MKVVAFTPLLNARSEGSHRMTYPNLLPEKTQHDLNPFPDKAAHQILADCARLADDKSR